MTWGPQLLVPDADWSELSNSPFPGTKVHVFSLANSHIGMCALLTNCYTEQRTAREHPIAQCTSGAQAPHANTTFFSAITPATMSHIATARVGMAGDNDIEGIW